MKRERLEGLNLEQISLAAGCFWCVEAIFEQLAGVVLVESGYMGGHLKNPSYKEVKAGETGHAEVCQITYHVKQISLEELLNVFWQIHDPTTINRQGEDIGTQYRSEIFYYTEHQKKNSKCFFEKSCRNENF